MIEALNETYGRRAAAFDAVEPPRRFEGKTRQDISYYADWAAYRERYLVDCLDRLAGMLRERGLRDIALFHNYPHPLDPGSASSGFTAPFNLAALEEKLDFVGWDIYSKDDELLVRAGGLLPPGLGRIRQREPLHLNHELAGEGVMRHAFVRRALHVRGSRHIAVGEDRPAFAHQDRRGNGGFIARAPAKGDAAGPARHGPERRFQWLTIDRVNVPSQQAPTEPHQ